MVAHYTTDKSPRGLAVALKINPFFAKDYMVGMQNYNMNKLIKIISYLREFDTRGKGVNNVSTSSYDLMRELVFKILHHLRPHNTIRISWIVFYIIGNGKLTSWFLTRVQHRRQIGSRCINCSCITRWS